MIALSTLQTRCPHVGRGRGDSRKARERVRQIEEILHRDGFLTADARSIFIGKPAAAQSWNSPAVGLAGARNSGRSVLAELVNRTCPPSPTRSRVALRTAGFASRTFAKWGVNL